MASATTLNPSRQRQISPELSPRKRPAQQLIMQEPQRKEIDELMALGDAAFGIGVSKFVRT